MTVITSPAWLGRTGPVTIQEPEQIRAYAGQAEVTG
jgi:hypothetical protein